MKTRLILVSLVMTIGIFIIPSLGFATTPEPPVNQATVTFTPGTASLPFCVDQSLFLLFASNTPISTADSFTLKVKLTENLCTPVNAKAAIYAMPTNGDAWPQKLVSTVPVTIQKAGTYTITFAKQCTPAQFDTIAQQFDVINGGTPDVIYSSLDHGPLLFPFDTGTAQQYFGKACPNETTTTTTTTTAPSTTTTTTTSTTSTTTTTTTIPVDNEVKICHRDNDAKKPYVEISPDENAQNGGGKNDHTSHTGPIATSVEVAKALKADHIKWGDIFPGMSAQGDAILAAHCKVPATEKALRK